MHKAGTVAGADKQHYRERWARMLRALLGQPGDPRFEAVCQQLELAHADGPDVRKKLRRQISAQRHPRAPFVWDVGNALNKSGAALMNGIVALYIAGYFRDYLSVIGLLEDPTDWEISAIVDLDAYLHAIDFSASDRLFADLVSPEPPRLTLLGEAIGANPEAYEDLLLYIDESWSKHVQSRRRPTQTHLLWHYIAALQDTVGTRFAVLQHVRSAIAYWSGRKVSRGVQRDENTV